MIFGTEACGVSVTLDTIGFKMENPAPSRPRSESWYGVVGFVREEGVVRLDERARRAVTLPQSEELDLFGLGLMLSIMCA